MERDNIKKPYYFLCTPLYSWSGQKLCWDEKLQKDWREILTRLEEGGLKVVVAFRDLSQNQTGAFLREKEFELIKKAEGVIVLLGNTPGIYAESGYANGLGKPLYGIRTERLKDFGEKVQSWIESIYARVFDDVGSLVQFLTKK